MVAVGRRSVFRVLFWLSVLACVQFYSVRVSGRSHASLRDGRRRLDELTSSGKTSQERVFQRKDVTPSTTYVRGVRVYAYRVYTDTKENVEITMYTSHLNSVEPTVSYIMRNFGASFLDKVVIYTNGSTELHWSYNEPSLIRIVGVNSRGVAYGAELVKESSRTFYERVLEATYTPDRDLISTIRQIVKRFDGQQFFLVNQTYTGSRELLALWSESAEFTSANIVIDVITRETDGRTEFLEKVRIDGYARSFTWSDSQRASILVSVSPCSKCTYGIHISPSQLNKFYETILSDAFIYNDMIPSSQVSTSFNKTSFYLVDHFYQGTDLIQLWSLDKYNDDQPSDVALVTRDRVSTAFLRDVVVNKQGVFEVKWSENYDFRRTEILVAYGKYGNHYPARPSSTENVVEFYEQLLRRKGDADEVLSLDQLEKIVENIDGRQYYLITSFRYGEYQLVLRGRGSGVSSPDSSLRVDLVSRTKNGTTEYLKETHLIFRGDPWFTWTNLSVIESGIIAETADNKKYVAQSPASTDSASFYQTLFATGKFSWSEELPQVTSTIDEVVFYLVDQLYNCSMSFMGDDYLNLARLWSRAPINSPKGRRADLVAYESKDGTVTYLDEVIFKPEGLVKLSSTSNRIRATALYTERDDGYRFMVELPLSADSSAFYQRVFDAQAKPDPGLVNVVKQVEKMVGGKRYYSIKSVEYSSSFVALLSEAPMSEERGKNVDLVVQETENDPRYVTGVVVSQAYGYASLTWSNRVPSTVTVRLDDSAGNTAVIQPSEKLTGDDYHNILSNNDLYRVTSSDAFQQVTRKIETTLYYLIEELHEEPALIRLWSKAPFGSPDCNHVDLVTKEEDGKTLYVEHIELEKRGDAKITYHKDPPQFIELKINVDGNSYPAQVSPDYTEVAFYLRFFEKPTDAIEYLTRSITADDKLVYLSRQYSEQGVLVQAWSSTEYPGANAPVVLITKKNGTQVQYLSEAVQVAGGLPRNTWVDDAVASTRFRSADKEGDSGSLQVLGDDVRQYVNSAQVAFVFPSEEDDNGDDLDASDDEDSWFAATDDGEDVKKTENDPEGSSRDTTEEHGGSSPDTGASSSSTTTTTTTVATTASTTASTSSGSSAASNGVSGDKAMLGSGGSGSGVTGERSGRVVVNAAPTPLASMPPLRLWVAAEKYRDNVRELRKSVAIDKFDKLLELDPAQQEATVSTLLQRFKPRPSSNTTKAVEELVSMNRAEREEWCAKSTSRNDGKMPTKQCITACTDAVKDGTVLFAKNEEPRHTFCTFGRGLRASVAWTLSLTGLVFVAFL